MLRYRARRPASLSFAALFSRRSDRAETVSPKIEEGTVQQVSVLWSLVTPKCRPDYASMFIEPCRWEASSEARTWANHQPATPIPFASLVQLVDAEEGNVREERAGV